MSLSDLKHHILLYGQRVSETLRMHKSNSLKAIMFTLMHVCAAPLHTVCERPFSVQSVRLLAASLPF